jgi:S1-C subfamily serine protease
MTACRSRPRECRFLGLFLLPFLLTFQSAAANGDFSSFEERLVTLFEENRSAMVRVKAVYPPEKESDEDIPQVVIGSGFFISREGLILTNASIVFEPLRVWIEHNQIAYSAEVIGMDERSNIAFLRTHTLPESFNFFHLADRSDLPPIGSFAIRLSMPLEFEASPTFGMVAGYESRFGERFFPCTYIRTTIPSGPGDGGSAYLDLSGRLIGIQVGSLPDVASSYILPARAALRIRDDILFSGMVTYGWIGFEVNSRAVSKAVPKLSSARSLPTRRLRMRDSCREISCGKSGTTRLIRWMTYVMRCSTPA